MVDVENQNNEQHQIHFISRLTVTRKSWGGCQNRAWPNKVHQVWELAVRGEDSKDSTDGIFILFYVNQSEEETEWISLTLMTRRWMDTADH